MRIACVLLVASCGSTEEGAVPVQAPVAIPMVADAGSPDASGANTILVRPMEMTGPFKSIEAACLAAKPCGFLDMDAEGMGEIHPATKTECALGPDRVDINAIPLDFDAEKGRTSVRLANGNLQIASQNCTVPKGLRREHSIYYGFVKAADGWWRSEALFEYDYNDKYGSGAMTTHWNNRAKAGHPETTFLGMQAVFIGETCSRQGTETNTLELMVRFEEGGAKPIVYPPLVVGQRFKQERTEGLGADEQNCRTIKRSVSLDEKWTGTDELELVGPPAWDALVAHDGTLMIEGSSEQAPSSAGHYRFVK
ncbi:MAG: hypothetical protein QM831_06075 [Kofleriaceae bacterium]